MNTNVNTTRNKVMIYRDKSKLNLRLSFLPIPQLISMKRAFERGQEVVNHICMQSKTAVAS